MFHPILNSNTVLQPLKCTIITGLFFIFFYYYSLINNVIVFTPDFCWGCKVESEDHQTWTPLFWDLTSKSTLRQRRRASSPLID